MRKLRLRDIKGLACGHKVPVRPWGHPSLHYPAATEPSLPLARDGRSCWPDVPCSLGSLSFLEQFLTLKKKKITYLFIWLLWALVASWGTFTGVHGLSSCGSWAQQLYTRLVALRHMGS